MIRCEPCQESSGLSSRESCHKHATMLSKNLRRAARARGRGQKRQVEAQHAEVRDAASERTCQAMRSQELASRRFAERAHGPPRGVEQYSASRGDLTELEASRSIAPSSVAGRANGEALAARQVLCARMGFWPFSVRCRGSAKRSVASSVSRKSGRDQVFPTLSQTMFEIGSHNCSYGNSHT